MEKMISDIPHLSLYTCIIITFIGIASNNAGRIKDPFIADNQTGAALVVKASCNYTISTLPLRNAQNLTLLAPLNWFQLNGYLDRTSTTSFNCVHYIATYNKKYSTQINIWLSLKMDTSFDLDLALNITKRFNQIYNGTITTLMLDYGLLLLDPNSYAIVREDLQTCSRKAVSANLRCGLMIDSMNCITSRPYLNQIGLEQGHIFIVSDDAFSFLHNKYSSRNGFACTQLLQNTGILVGHKIDVVVDDKFTEVENGTINGTSATKSWYHHIPPTEQNFSSTYFSDDGWLDYFVFNMIEETVEFSEARKYNPVKDVHQWLTIPTKFEKGHFGASIHSGGTLTLPRKLVIALFETFPTVLIEMDIMKEDHENIRFVQEITGAANQLPRNNGKLQALPEILLGMNIRFENSDRNEMVLNRTLAAAAAGNDVYPGIVTTILFNWAVLLLDTDHILNITLERCVRQAKALEPIMEMALSQNQSKIRFGIMWEIAEIEGIFKSKPSSSPEVFQLFTHHLDFHVSYADPIVLKMTLLTKPAIWRDLFVVTRTLIYTLTPYINAMKDFVGMRSSPPTVWVYLGIAECKGGPYTNYSELTDFVLFWEIISTWATSADVKVILNTAYETKTAATEKDCAVEYVLSGRSPCMCGWWVVSNESEISRGNGEGYKLNYMDKKSLALKLYESAHVHEGTTPETTKDSTGSYNNILIVIVCPAAVLFCGLVGVVTACIVHHYRSKNVISKREVRNFLLGTRKHSEVSGTERSTQAEGGRYDKEKYEVESSLFLIDYEHPLGEGDYASVYEGTVNRPEGSIKVAVKMKSKRLAAGDQQHGNRLAFRSLISEIKVLSYVGEHLNIVGLVGAYTAKLRKGVVILFLELCPLGSLDKYLRAYTPEGRNTIGMTGGIAESSFIIDHDIENDANGQRTLPREFLYDLARWTREILSGMEFLTSKGVVHADLATRNVLLDASKTAKISDFGLSRRLYNYSEYLKREETPLPWRWMAPESLRKLTFNEKTDIWSFGVTLWEMYTLGDIPYPGLSYHINIPVLLTTPIELGGVRLEKPKYSCDRIYEVLQRCWHIFPRERPTFAELKTLFTVEFQTLFA